MPDLLTQGRSQDSQIRDLQGLTSDLNLAQVCDLSKALPDTDLSDPFGILLDRCYQENRVARVSRRIRVSGGFTVKCPGLEFDSIPFGNVGDACIEPIGTGYTVLTVTSQPFRFAVAISGAGQTINGVYFNNATFCDIQKVRVLNLDGFGVKFDKWWDSIAHHISVEQCGSASEYAAQFNGAGDTTNMSVVMQLQVEQAKKKAIYVDPVNLCCHFLLIHSERAAADGSYTTWSLGGARCQYDVVRLHNASGTASVRLEGENSQFGVVNAENMAITLNGESASRLRIAVLNAQGSTVSVDVANHSGPVHIEEARIGTLYTDLETTHEPGLLIDNATIDTVDVGDIGNPAIPERLHLRNCQIGVLQSHSSNSAVLIEGGRCADFGNGLGYCIKFRGGRHTAHAGGSTFNAGAAGASCGLIVEGSGRISGNVTTASTVLASGLFRFEGNLTQSGGTNVSCLGDDVVITGTATGLSTAPAGAPTVHVQLPSNQWPRGATHWDPVATSGATPGWRCTAAGAPGTWKAMANLA